MQETWVRSLGREDPLEKEMATYFSTLAWKIPRMEEPGRLQSMGFSRQEYWSGLLCPSSGDLPNPRTESTSQALAGGFFTTFLVAQTVKASAYNSGDLGLIPGLGRSPGEGNGNLLQYSCLENPMDGEAW